MELIGNSVRQSVCAAGFLVTDVIHRRRTVLAYCVLCVEVSAGGSLVVLSR